MFKKIYVAVWRQRTKKYREENNICRRKSNVCDSVTTELPCGLWIEFLTEVWYFYQILAFVWIIQNYQKLHNVTYDIEKNEDIILLKTAVTPNRFSDSWISTCTNNHRGITSRNLAVSPGTSLVGFINRYSMTTLWKRFAHYFPRSTEQLVAGPKNWPVMRCHL